MYLNRKIRFYYNLKIARSIPVENVEKHLNDYKVKNNMEVFKNNHNLGYYLAGLLEGDGHISLPSLGITTLNRVLNPRIVFTSHVNNIGITSPQKVSLKEVSAENIIPPYQKSIFVSLLLSGG